jgi:hypothetical protein
MNLAGDLPGLPPRFQYRRQEFRGAENLGSITRRVDELARELDQRQSRSTDAETTALKHCLKLVREIRQAERRLSDGDGNLHRQDIHPTRRATSFNEVPPQPSATAELHAGSSVAKPERKEPRPDGTSRPIGDRPRQPHDDGDDGFHRQFNGMPRERDQQYLPETALDEVNNSLHSCAEQLEERGRHAGDDDALSAVRFDSAAMPLDQRQSEALKAGLAAVKALLNSKAPQRDRPPGRGSDASMRQRFETAPLDRDQESTVVPDRWIAGPDHERGQMGTSADRPATSDFNRVLPPIPARICSARRADAVDEAPRRSGLPLFARAGLAALLAATIAATGLYFVRLRISEPSAETPVAAQFQQNAPVGQVAASLSTGDIPRRAPTRLQDPVFPVPKLYGIYAINGGKLFELETLPGRVPDQRIAVSAAISQPSRTTLPDGRVAFLVFRRDMAADISERVAIRVVAGIKQTMTFDPVGESRGAAVESVWTIRNIAFDFRVEPVEHNRDMVLLRPESSTFTLPAGRYALVLKGQAYDFAVDGPVTDPAQCLERVEAANGNFFHECQQPEAATAGPPAPETPPTLRSPIKKSASR